MDTIRAFQTFASEPLDAFVLLLTNLGSEQAYILLLVITFIGISPKIGQRLGITLLSSFYLNQQMKHFFDTPRPFQLEPDIVRSEAAAATALGEAFPSGHAQGGATFWGLAALYIQKTWFWVVAIILILLLAFSRIYLGVHFPIDVVGGVIAGAVIALIAFRVFQQFELSERPSTWIITVVTLIVLLTLQLVFPTADSALLLGATGGFILGPQYITHYPSQNMTKRVILTLIAIILFFAVFIGSSLLLPEIIKRDPVGGFIRYLVISLAATWLIPYLGRLTGLADKPQEA